MAGERGERGEHFRNQSIDHLEFSSVAPTLTGGQVIRVCCSLLFLQGAGRGFYGQHRSTA